MLPTLVRSSARATATLRTPADSSSDWKLRDDREASASQIIERLRPKLAQVPGVRLFLQPAQDITVGGRIARGQFQYVLQDPDLHELDLGRRA